MDNLYQRLAFNHATFGPTTSFTTFLQVVAKTGAAGVGVWTERLDGLSPRAAGQLVRDHGLKISGVNRGGFFTGSTQKRQLDAIGENKRQIEHAAELGADTLIIVPGGLSSEVRDIASARRMVAEGLAAVTECAVDCNVRLAIEPFHPVLSATRSVINTLDLALDLCEELGGQVGVATDIFHIWWDPNVYRAIERAGPRILGHHLCDWKLDTADPLTDRGLMGEGVADIAGLTAAVMQAGYEGWMEIEIFSRNHLWQMQPDAIAVLCIERAQSCLQTAGRLCNDARQACG
jgi:sugar phosphate isomerase/epimerase